MTDPLRKDIDDIHKFADELYKRNFNDFLKKYIKEQSTILDDCYKILMNVIPPPRGDEIVIKGN